MDATRRDATHLTSITRYHLAIKEPRHVDGDIRLAGACWPCNHQNLSCVITPMPTEAMRS